MATAVRTAVRVRPLNRRERAVDAFSIVQVSGNGIAVADPNILTRVDDANFDENARKFHYDHAYTSQDPADPQFASQETVFNDLGAFILDNAWKGFNCSMFAYGQTGAGKSYTMMGAEQSDVSDQRGLIPRTCEALFDKMSSGGLGVVYTVEVSYLEIYNEQVRDLFNPQWGKAGGLKVREHPRTGPYVEGLSHIGVSTLVELQQLMAKGNESRTVASTDMNQVSSRSHAVFTVRFSQAELADATGNGGVSSESKSAAEPRPRPSGKAAGKMVRQKKSKIHLVDLAGSERADQSGARGKRLKEAAAINQSLSTLGEVIKFLTEKPASGGRSKRRGGSSGRDFVPYRRSQLTWLLKDSLGGNSKTVMVAAISPASICSDETLGTLRFMERAKRVQSNAIANVDQNGNEALLLDLRKQVAKLQAALEARGSGEEKVVYAIDPDMSAKFEGLKEQLASRDEQITSLQREWEEKLARESERLRQRQEAMEEERLALKREAEEARAAAAAAAAAAEAAEAAGVTTAPTGVSSGGVDTGGGDNGRAVSTAPNSPYLLNLSELVGETELPMYSLRTGLTLLGTHPDCDIHLTPTLLCDDQEEPDTMDPFGEETGSTRDPGSEPTAAVAVSGDSSGSGGLFPYQLQFMVEAGESSEEAATTHISVPAEALCQRAGQPHHAALLSRSVLLNGKAVLAGLPPGTPYLLPPGAVLLVGSTHVFRFMTPRPARSAQSTGRPARRLSLRMSLPRSHSLAALLSPAEVNAAATAALATTPSPLVRSSSSSPTRRRRSSKSRPPPPPPPPAASSDRDSPRSPAATRSRRPPPPPGPEAEACDSSPSPTPPSVPQIGRSRRKTRRPPPPSRSPAPPPPPPPPGEQDAPTPQSPSVFFPPSPSAAASSARSSRARRRSLTRSQSMTPTRKQAPPPPPPPPPPPEEEEEEGGVPAPSLCPTPEPAAQSPPAGRVVRRTPSSRRSRRASLRPPPPPAPPSPPIQPEPAPEAPPPEPEPKPEPETEPALEPEPEPEFAPEPKATTAGGLAPEPERAWGDATPEYEAEFEAEVQAEISTEPEPAPTQLTPATEIELQSEPEYTGDLAGATGYALDEAAPFATEPDGTDEGDAAESDTEASLEWWYIDDTNTEQGPFYGVYMHGWYSTDRLAPELPIRCEGWDQYYALSAVVETYGAQVFAATTPQALADQMVATAAAAAAAAAAEPQQSASEPQLEHAAECVSGSADANALPVLVADTALAGESAVSGEGTSAADSPLSTAGSSVVDGPSTATDLDGLEADPSAEARFDTAAPHSTEEVEDVSGKEELEPSLWLYWDNAGEEQGPFGAAEMEEWYQCGYLVEELPVRRPAWTQHVLLCDLLDAYGPQLWTLAPLLQEQPQIEADVEDSGVTPAEESELSVESEADSGGGMDQAGEETLRLDAAAALATEDAAAKETENSAAAAALAMAHEMTLMAAEDSLSGYVLVAERRQEQIARSDMAAEEHAIREFMWWELDRQSSERREMEAEEATQRHYMRSAELARQWEVMCMAREEAEGKEVYRREREREWEEGELMRREEHQSALYREQQRMEAELQVERERERVLRQERERVRELKRGERRERELERERARQARKERERQREQERAARRQREQERARQRAERVLMAREEKVERRRLVKLRRAAQAERDLMWEEEHSSREAAAAESDRLARECSDMATEEELGHAMANALRERQDAERWVEEREGAAMEAQDAAARDLRAWERAARVQAEERGRALEAAKAAAKARHVAELALERAQSSASEANKRLKRQQRPSKPPSAKGKEKGKGKSKGKGKGKAAGKTKSRDTGKVEGAGNDLAPTAEANRPLSRRQSSGRLGGLRPRSRRHRRARSPTVASSGALAASVASSPVAAAAAAGGRPESSKAAAAQADKGWLPPGLSLMRIPLVAAARRVRGPLVSTASLSAAAAAAGIVRRRSVEDDELLSPAVSPPLRQTAKGSSEEGSTLDDSESKALAARLAAEKAEVERQLEAERQRMSAQWAAEVGKREALQAMYRRQLAEAQRELAAREEEIEKKRAELERWAQEERAREAAAAASAAASAAAAASAVVTASDVGASTREEADTEQGVTTSTITDADEQAAATTQAEELAAAARAEERERQRQEERVLLDLFMELREDDDDWLHDLRTDAAHEDRHS